MARSARTTAARQGQLDARIWIGEYNTAALGLLRADLADELHVIRQTEGHLRQNQRDQLAYLVAAIDCIDFYLALRR